VQCDGQLSARGYGLLEGVSGPVPGLGQAAPHSSFDLAQVRKERRWAEGLTEGPFRLAEAKKRILGVPGRRGNNLRTASCIYLGLDELLIDCEQDRTLRSVVFGVLAEERS
jgi:hypothetical protein